MTVKQWLTILILEVLVVCAVIFLFSKVDRQIAGLIAGFIFGILGLVIGFQLLRTRTLKSFTFLWLFVYMFYSVIPMILNRLNSWNSDFTDVEIWGMSGPEFHKVSEKIYLILILATLIDLVITRRLLTKRDL